VTCVDGRQRALTDVDVRSVNGPLVNIGFYSYVLVFLLSTTCGTECPIMCWCAVKKLLTHSLVDSLAVVLLCSWRTPCSTKSWNTAAIWRTSRWTRTSRAKPRRTSSNTCPSSPARIARPTTRRSVTMLPCGAIEAAVIGCNFTPRVFWHCWLWARNVIWPLNRVSNTSGNPENLLELFSPPACGVEILEI